LFIIITRRTEDGSTFTNPAALTIAQGRTTPRHAPRPSYSVLASGRGVLMPSLDDALERYADAIRSAA